MGQPVGIGRSVVVNGLGNLRRIAATILAVAAIAVAGQSAAIAATEHCPTGGVKVEATADELNLIVPAAGTLVCVKGSTEATGIVVADGVQTLVEILGNGHDVSYFVTYEEVPTSSPPVDQSTPTPTITAEPTATPTTTPTTEPSAEPSASADPSVTPDPTDTPIGDSDPDPLPTMPATDTADEAAARTVNPLLSLVLLVLSAVIGFGATLARVRDR
jgi:hypothetical protein